MLTQAFVARFELHGPDGEQSIPDPAAALPADWWWHLLVYPTQAENDPGNFEPTVLRTKVLIISAGAIGSSEIMLRSIIGRAGCAVANIAVAVSTARLRSAA
jgi:hypothetical protein